MTKRYKELPKKYVKIGRNNPTDLKINFATWSYPHKLGNYIYYVYMTMIQGDHDCVYRFTIEEHEELLKLYGIEKMLGLDKSWMSDCCEPYIECEQNL